MLDAVRAIVIVQRDNGDRANRKHARMKYLIADRGIAWFRAEVERVAGFALEPWRPLPPWTIPEPRGWNAQGDGRWFYVLDILSGRVRDRGAVKLKTALREIVDATGRDLVATPNQNLLIVGVEDAQRATIDAILARNGVSDSADAFDRRAMACPAMPTCGLALAEAERFLPELLDDIRAAWKAANLGENAPTIRMTGCPNSCARPTMGEIGIIGVSADSYNVYVGGSAVSTRLNAVYRERVRGAEIAGVLAPLFAVYASATRRSASSPNGDGHPKQACGRNESHSKGGRRGERSFWRGSPVIPCTTGRSIGEPSTPFGRRCGPISSTPESRTSR
jgi:sulfite reductase beta subunit-like hemoprotein